MEYLRVKNWEQFQQYKDRDPKWIKLERSLLSDYEFHQLDETTQLHLLKIWLLAAKTGNAVPNDAAWIAQQIGAKSKVDLKQLITAGFLFVYDGVQECTETYLEESRGEENREEKKEKRGARKTRLPSDWQPSEKLISYCREKRPDLDPATTFEDFRDYYLSHGRTMADWDLTAMRWVRNEKRNDRRTGQRETAVQRSERIEREELAKVAGSIG